MLAPDRIVRLNTVLARTGLSRSTIYRKIAEGTFPAQLRISINGAGWRESDINRWIARSRGVAAERKKSMGFGEAASRPSIQRTSEVFRHGVCFN